MVIRPLKGAIAFQQAVTNGKRFSSGPATIIVSCRSKNGTSPTVFIGVVIGKRTSSKAVVRVRLRRLIRVAMRNALRRLGDQLIKSRIDTIVVAWRSAPAMPSLIRLDDVEPVVEHILMRSIAAPTKS